MKVLIVSSSPRKEGNSDVLCDRFARGASEAGHEVEKIMLRDKKIFIRCLPDAQERGIVYGMGTWDKGDVYRHPSYEQSYEMGKKV